MKQQSLATTGFELATKRTRKREFLDEMNLVYELEPTAAFNRTMLAEQHYQSMAIDFIPESVKTDFGDEVEDTEDELV